MSLRAAAALEIEYLSQFSRLSTICSEHGAAAARGNESLFGIGRLPYNHLGYLAVLSLEEAGKGADSSMSCFFPSVEAAREAARAVAVEADCAVALHLGPNCGIFTRTWTLDGTFAIREVWKLRSVTAAIEIPYAEQHLPLSQSAGHIFAEEAEKLEQNRCAAERRRAESELNGLLERWAQNQQLKEISSVFDYIPETPDCIALEVRVSRKNKPSIAVKRTFRISRRDHQQHIQSLRAAASVEDLDLIYSAA